VVHRASVKDAFNSIGCFLTSDNYSLLIAQVYLLLKNHNDSVPVSVIIPCYRCAATVQRAMESVFAQTVRPLQVIIIDDASDDDTLHQLYRILDKYGKDWVDVIALPTNVGAGEARNAGWLRARYEWIAFLDADDTWHPQKIEIQYNFVMSNRKFTITAHRHRFVKTCNEFNELQIKDGYTVIRWAALLISNRFITPSVMVKRELPFRFPPGIRYMEDHFLWLRSVSEGYNIARLNSELAVIHKEPFGQAGLSSHLIAMEIDELDNYWRLYRMHKIGRFALVMLIKYSMLKFIRRCVITTLQTNRA